MFSNMVIPPALPQDGQTVMLQAANVASVQYEKGVFRGHLKTSAVSRCISAHALCYALQAFAFFL